MFVQLQALAARLSGLCVAIANLCQPLPPPCPRRTCDYAPAHSAACLREYPRPHVSWLLLGVDFAGFAMVLRLVLVPTAHGHKCFLPAFPCIPTPGYQPPPSTPPAARTCDASFVLRGKPLAALAALQLPGCGAASRPPLDCWFVMLLPRTAASPPCHAPTSIA